MGIARAGQGKLGERGSIQFAVSAESAAQTSIGDLPAEQILNTPLRVIEIGRLAGDSMQFERTHQKMGAANLSPALRRMIPKAKGAVQIVALDAALFEPSRESCPRADHQWRIAFAWRNHRIIFGAVAIIGVRFRNRPLRPISPGALIDMVTHAA